jgi:diadenosine tetraphosphate (Ap4A) HIT family hydrolase
MLPVLLQCGQPRLDLDRTRIASPDAYPVADGYTLINPRKHVGSIYELKMDEQNAL